MRKSLLIFTGLCLSLLFAGAAHAQVQIFGGYSYVRPTINIQQPAITCVAGSTCPPTSATTHVNLNGWEVSGTYNMFKVLGLTADFGGNYGRVQGSPLHVNTYLFGPQIHFPGPISPFAHVLIGEAHERIESSSSPNAIIPGSANAFATAVGGGIDVKTVPFISLRLIQIDYLVTHFGSRTQNQPRASAGIVIHF